MPGRDGVRIFDGGSLIFSVDWSISTFTTPESDEGNLPDTSKLREMVVKRLDDNNKKCRDFLNKVRESLGIEKTIEQLFDEVINKKGNFVIAPELSGTPTAGLARYGKKNRDVGLREADSPDRYINTVIHELIHRAGIESHTKYARAAFQAQSVDDQERNSWAKGKGDSADSNYFSRVINENCPMGGE